MESYDSSLVEPIEIRMIRPSQFPTRSADPPDSPELESLRASIREHGLLQPIVVRPLERGFEIVAGHRRFAACRSLRWRFVLCKIVELDDKQAYEIQLTENLQRKTLDPVEEAVSYQRYVVEFGWGGVSELGRRIGKSEEYVSHRIQLLKLPDEVRQQVTSRMLGVSQAMELTDGRLGPKVRELAQEIINNKLTVKQVRRIKSQMKQTVADFDYSGMAPAAATVADGDGTQIRQQQQQSELRAAAAPKESAIVRRSILALRIALSRIDDLIEDANRGGPQDKVELIQFLMDVRRQTHDMIDDALKYKREHLSSAQR